MRAKIMSAFQRLGRTIKAFFEVEYAYRIH